MKMKGSTPPLVLLKEASTGEHPLYCGARFPVL